MARKTRISETHVSDFIATHLREAVKQHLVYDGFGRMVATYVANIDAKAGEACMLTQYYYDGTSNRISFMREVLSTWDETWEVP